MGQYQDWGFVDNPFTTMPLQANEQGKALLIGRDVELRGLINRITNPPRIPTIEGGIGTGKTSLVNVATFELTSKYLRGEMPELYVACRQQFQITDRAGLRNLEEQFYFEVAQTLIELNDQAHKFECTGPVREQINKWMNGAMYNQVQLGLSVFGHGPTFGGGTSPSTTTGFDRSGFPKVVREWLKEVFPAHRGGVVCLIDNMELLEESSEARAVAEELRDTLFSLQGIRWVLCGANGIIQGVVASPRLDGRISSPIEVKEIPDGIIPEVLNSRIEAFAKFSGGTYLPITQSAFHVLYNALNKNLRNLLSTTDEFCTWIGDQTKHPQDDKAKDDAFFEWFDKETKGVYEAVAGQIKPRAWQVFDKIVASGGQTSPGEFEVFGFATQQVMRPHVKDLEAAGLLQSTRDEKDQRRKSIVVTSKGFKAYYHRQKFGLVSR